MPQAADCSLVKMELPASQKGEKLKLKLKMTLTLTLKLRDHEKGKSHFTIRFGAKIPSKPGIE